MSSENLVSPAKFLGSGMKWEISETDSPKCGKSCEIYFPTVLNTLCETLPIFHKYFNAPSRSNSLF